MSDADIFKDFLGGDSPSAEYMRKTLGVTQDGRTGQLHYAGQPDSTEQKSGRTGDGQDLLVSEEVMDNLLKKAAHIERPKEGFSAHSTNFAGTKICATRHGCKGATNCDRSYGAPVGR